MTGTTTELIYIMDASFNASAVRPAEPKMSRDRRCRQTAIDATCGINRVGARGAKQMGITTIFRDDRFRVVSGIASGTTENSRHPSYKARLARVMRRADARRPAIVAACGHDRATTQDQEQMHITAIRRSDCGRVVFRKSAEIPGNSSENEPEQKKISRFGLLPRRKARQNAGCRRP